MANDITNHPMWKLNALSKKYIGCPRDLDWRLSLIELDKQISLSYYRVIADKFDGSSVDHNMAMALSQNDTEYLDYLRQLTLVVDKKRINIGIKKRSDQINHKALNDYIIKHKLQRKPRIMIHLTEKLQNIFSFTPDIQIISIFDLHRQIPENISIALTQ